MSRVYLTATMKHTSFGIDMPVFSVQTSDHTGGGYAVGGLHPTSIAAMAGKGPEIKKGERFDVKVNCNKQRASVSLVVATQKHLPHIEWSSAGGLGKLPLGLGALLPMFLGSSSKTKKKISQRLGSDKANARKQIEDRKERDDSRVRSPSRSNSNSHSSPSRSPSPSPRRRRPAPPLAQHPSQRSSRTSSYSGSSYSPASSNYGGTSSPPKSEQRAIEDGSASESRQDTMRPIERRRSIRYDDESWERKRDRYEREMRRVEEGRRGTIRRVKEEEDEDGTGEEGEDSDEGYGSGGRRREGKKGKW